MLLATLRYDTIGIHRTYRNVCYLSAFGGGADMGGHKVDNKIFFGPYLAEREK